MAYLDFEVSQHGGRPVELFEFVGTYETFRYTSADRDLDKDGYGYTAVSIKRSAVKAGTQEDDNLDLSVELPASLDIVKAYAFNVTPPKLHLNIWRIHRDTGDFILYWTGPVLNISVSNGTATMRIPSVMSLALQGDLPSVYYQTPCNHVLGDRRCMVDLADYTVETTAAFAEDVIVSVLSLGGKPEGFFNAGEIVNAVTSERRMVIAQTGQFLTVNFPFAKLWPGAPVRMVAGCNHAYDGDCRTKFNNNRRYGGFPLIPTENPFSSGIG